MRICLILRHCSVMTNVTHFSRVTQWVMQKLIDAKISSTYRLMRYMPIFNAADDNHLFLAFIWKTWMEVQPKILWSEKTEGEFWFSIAAMHFRSIFRWKINIFQCLWCLKLLGEIIILRFSANFYGSKGVGHICKTQRLSLTSLNLPP